MDLQRLDTLSRRRHSSWGAFALSVATICLSYSPILSANGQEIQAHADIQQTIKQYVKAELPASFRITTLVGKIDPHLRLQKCQQALEAFYPTGARKLGPTTVGVRCLGAVPWQIYVPIQVKAFGPAVISKRALPRGTILHANDLSIATRELSSAMRGYYTSPDEIEGMELRYSLANGSIIGPKSVKPRHLVKRGDIVTILAETNGLHIRVKGMALMDGFRGQSIRIKNTRSKRVLQGEVVASRTVRIRL